MANQCEITGKSKQFGNRISNSQRHTKRTWSPNVHKKTFLLDGKKVTMKVSAAGIRLLKKQGRYASMATLLKEKSEAK